MVILIPLISCAEKERESEIYLLPDDYVGDFYIIYDVGSGEVPVYVGSTRLFELSETGMLHTQLTFNAGIGDSSMMRFFYVSEDGRKKEIIERYGSAIEDTEENRKDKRLYIMGGGFGTFGFTEETTARGCKYTHQHFYIGTLSDGLDSKGNFRFEDYYLEHGYLCDGQIFKVK